MNEGKLERLERMWLDGTPLTDIATALGYDRLYVASIISRNRKRFPYRHKQVARSVRDGWVARIIAGRTTKAEAARKLGVKYQTVDRWVREERRRGDVSDQ